ncbi:MAG: photosystem P840 reaction-center cytochrome c-551 [Deltaproteobacteria bacterium]|nr:photosystem P840 reaction-center cytochrome c-551 [Candidatus Anaeroferrophillus wilburensis]MBN2887865.1 photosystem P840 reaction-center cytochrome c-551 [Deltaproteobacteria bacterium]
MKKLLFIMALGTATLFLLAYPKTGVLAADNQHQQLFESKCSKCHALDRVKNAHQTKAQLSETIKRMAKKQGADISAEDLEALDEYILTLDLDTGS